MTSELPARVLTIDADARVNVSDVEVLGGESWESRNLILIVHDVPPLSA